MNSLAKENMNIAVESLKKISETDLADLCNITEQAIKAGGGFGWLTIPPIETLKKYWNGLILIKSNISFTVIFLSLSTVFKISLYLFDLFFISILLLRFPSTLLNHK